MSQRFIFEIHTVTMLKRAYQLTATSRDEAIELLGQFNHEIQTSAASAGPMMVQSVRVVGAVRAPEPEAEPDDEADLLDAQAPD